MKFNIQFRLFICLDNYLLIYFSKKYPASGEALDDL